MTHASDGRASASWLPLCLGVAITAVMIWVAAMHLRASRSMSRSQAGRSSSSRSWRSRLSLSTHDQVLDARGEVAAHVRRSGGDGDLARTVRVVPSREGSVHPAPCAALAASIGGGRIDELTAREREVLRLLALGHTNREIAEHVSVSMGMVESDRAAVMTTLRVGTRAGLARAAREAGLLAEER